MDINNSNAESVGRPIVEKAIRLFAQSDHAQFLESFPNVRTFKEREIFNDTAENLKRLGDSPSVDFLDRLDKPNQHLLMWKIQSQNSGKALFLALVLNDTGGASSMAVMGTKTVDEALLKDAEDMLAKAEMNEDNAEAIGTPIIETILTSMATADFEKYCQILPDAHKEKLQKTREIFEEAVGVLKPMGELKSIKYLAHARMTDLHLLIWKVRYQKDDEELLWQLMLNESDGEIKTHGLGFDR